MNADFKGAMFLSICLHFAVAVAFALFSMVTPEKDPEPFVFQMYGDPGQVVKETAPVFEPIEYKSDVVEMPDPKDFEPDIPEPVELEPEPEPEPIPLPVVPLPEPKKEPVRPEPKKEPVKPPKKEKISYQDFGAVTKPQNVPKKAPSKPRPTPSIDLSKDIAQMTRNLKNMVSSSSSSSIDSLSTGDVRSLEAYFYELQQTVRDNIETHTLGARPLEATVSFNLSANGSITNVKITRSSGDAVYDSKVLAGVKRVRFFKATPFGKSHALNFPIRQANR